MGNPHNVLVGAPAQVRVLFPERILADAQRADARGLQQSDDAP
jgi:hypothetical protein